MRERRGLRGWPREIERDTERIRIRGRNEKLVRLCGPQQYKKIPNIQTVQQ